MFRKGDPTMKKTLFLISALALSSPGWAKAMNESPDAWDALLKVQSMVGDPKAQSVIQGQGLSLVDLTWEDTGRYKNSAVGPNISDMTIQIQRKDPRTGAYSLHCMPVIRHPNFSDRTGDVTLDKFYLLVGNEKGQDLRRVTLKDFLSEPRRYLHDPKSWPGGKTSLLAPRDSHALVSAQSCLLPIPPAGKAEFNPVLFNYQSRAGDPAVLTILATREGTSVTVIDNTRDAFAAGRTWGQRLFFNKDGERASLTGERLSDFIASGQAPAGAEDPSKGLNMVLLIQVPLKQKQPLRPQYSMDMSEMCGASVPLMCKKSSMEMAVIGHGEVEGPFTEIAGIDIERDPAFPVRVTVQFYKATSDGAITEDDARLMAQQIDKVYRKADYVGSLVVGGDTGRPTEYIGDKVEPSGWWQAFWNRHPEWPHRHYSRPPAAPR
jgi:hypothetical protein